MPINQRLAVSAIVPLYNKRDTVVEAVESILAQTRPPDEIIIVDDGSTDGSGELILERYGSNPLVRLIRQPNRGVSAARNAAIAASTSPLLAFLDADDKWLPRRVEIQAALMENNDGCMIVLPSAVLSDAKSGATWIEGDKIDKRNYLRSFFRHDCLIVTSGVMLRNSAVEQVGPFDESLYMGEDADLWLRVIKRFGFEHLPQPVVWYRCCRSDALESVERDFRGVDRFYAKHRHCFGRGLKGRIIWREAYAAVLRRQAVWHLRHRHGKYALKKLLKASCLWPFFNPCPIAKSGLEYALGPKVYRAAVALARKLAPRRGNAVSSIDS
jgi:glycosyltransferase involved in cell wall biosynthesis